MLLRLVVVGVLALAGFARSAPGIRGSSTSQGRVVAQKVSGASAATQVLTSDSGHRSDGVLLKDLDVVVPPVEPSDKVVKPDVPPQAQAAAGVVVADQLVTSNRVESEVVQSVGFQTLGVTWPENAKGGDLGGQVRTRTNGAWLGGGAPARGGGAPRTGAAAAAVLRGLVKSPVRVITPAGDLNLRWAGPADDVYLAGPAEVTATGEYVLGH